jgi:SAM-dependent methyltransferase
MDPRDLPIVGVISNCDKDFYGHFTDLHGKNVLCIGFSESEIEAYVEKYGTAKITTLTNWEDHADAKVQKFPLVMGDITKKTDLKDDSFDAVLTLSVLEHLTDLSGAFDEMTRIVRNGGEMIHMFGPAWSCAYGHHIYENPDDPLLNFTSWKMPAHMHLLCSNEEIIKYYADMGYAETAAFAAIHWFFEAPIINRIFYDDYMKIFLEDRFQIDRMEVMYSELPSTHIQRLRNIYTSKHDFSSYGSKYRLIIRK